MRPGRAAWFHSWRWVEADGLTLTGKRPAPQNPFGMKLGGNHRSLMTDPQLPAILGQYGIHGEKKTELHKRHVKDNLFSALSPWRYTFKRYLYTVETFLSSKYQRSTWGGKKAVRKTFRYSDIASSPTGTA